jgi:ketosteroid isomerase-like protein
MITPGALAESARHTTAAAWVASFQAGWRAPRDAASFVAHFAPILAGNVCMVQPQAPITTGIDQFRRVVVEPLFTLAPDIRAEVDGWAAHGDVIYIAITVRATIGGRPVSWHVIDQVTLRDGAAVQRVSHFDPTPLLRAIVTRPRSWPRFLRAQRLMRRHRRNRRGSA